MKRIQSINDQKLEFEFTNKSMIDLDEKYDKAGEIFNGVLNGKKHVSNSIKLISVCCKSKNIDEDYIVNNAKANEFLELPALANNLVLDYFGTKKQSSDNNKEDSKKK